MNKGKQYWIDKLGEGWAIALKDTLKSPYMTKLQEFLTMEYTMNRVHPTEQEIFKYFKLCPREKLKMVIMYKEPGIDTSIFPHNYDDSYIDELHNGALSKIFECIRAQYDDNSTMFFSFDHTFETWAKQGVLFLPTMLTTRKGRDHSKAWKTFVQAVIENIKVYYGGTCFLLWGDEAKEYSESLSYNQHVFSWESPANAFREDRPWECPNFKAVDKLLEYLHGKNNNIQW
jgi:uracil-DNA glycosylase